MKTAIRCDASPGIGTGHFMRCLALAEALRERGAAVRFICRQTPEHLARLAATQSNELAALPDWPAELRPPAGQLIESPWSSGQQALDAEQSRAAAAGCELLAVDHYALDARWESAMRAPGRRLLALDDLARTHDCDALLDPNVYLDAERRYDGRLPTHCLRLLGPRYALLRPEFRQARRQAVPRDGAVRRLLIFMGGVDAANVTETVLQALHFAGMEALALDVVIGPDHPARARVEALCAMLPQARCHVHSSRMAELMTQADLAVGAGGSATWERCAVGLPTLALCVADNQRQLLHDAARQGLLYTPGEGLPDADTLALHLRALLANAGLRHHLSCNGLALVDGEGARRAAAALAVPSIVMRRVQAEDCAALHAWRNHPAVRAVSRNQAEIPFEEHRRWFEQVRQAPDHHLLLGEQAGRPVGVVRFDERGGSADVSIYLVPERIGRGEGAALLLAAEAWLRAERPGVGRLDAEVRDSNAPSLRLFELCGYRREHVTFSKGL